MEQTNLYSMTIPVMMKSLTALSGVLDKALEHAKTKASERLPVEKQMEALFNDRLIFDQFSLIRQIQIVSDNAKGTAARLAEIEMPKYEDNEKTFEEVKARIAKTIEFLKTIKPEQVAGKENIKIMLPFHPGKYLLGFEYVTQSALPNFFFHYATAYDIMRKNGVNIGKADFIGGLEYKDL